MIVYGGDGCGGVDREVGGTNGDIEPLEDQLLDPLEELPRWPEPREEGVWNV